MTEPTPFQMATPRSKYIANPSNIKVHRTLLENEALQKGLDVALAEYVRAVVVIAGSNQLTDNNAMFAQAACFNQISGACAFLEVFHRVGDPYPQKTQKRDDSQLT